MLRPLALWARHVPTPRCVHFVYKMCPVCVHFQTVRNYVAASSLQDFVSMCPLFPVGLGVL